MHIRDEPSVGGLRRRRGEGGLDRRYGADLRAGGLVSYRHGKRHEVSRGLEKDREELKGDELDRKGFEIHWTDGVPPPRTAKNSPSALAHEEFVASAIK